LTTLNSLTSEKTAANRINFSKSKNPIDYPDFLEIQLKSFKDFFQLETTADNRTQEGLYKVFSENFPITDSRNNFVLEFLDYFVDPPRYSLEECIERGTVGARRFFAPLIWYQLCIIDHDGGCVFRPHGYTTQKL